MPNSIKSFTSAIGSGSSGQTSYSNPGFTATVINPILSQFGNSTISWTDTNPSVKKYEVVETTEDIVALSVTAHRMFKENSTYYKLLDAELFTKVTYEDREHAKAIKDYYSKKVMMYKLQSDRKLSPFREDLNKLIHTDGMTFRESMVGVAYWLPEFYNYDMKLDGIKMQVETNQLFDKLNKQGKPGTLKLSADLQPIECIQRKSKRVKNHQYWFKDTKLNAGVVIHVEDKNQLKHVWDHVFNSEKTVKIAGQYTRQTLDNFEYFSVRNWELQKG